MRTIIAVVYAGIEAKLLVFLKLSQPMDPSRPSYIKFTYISLIASRNIEEKVNGFEE